MQIIPSEINYFTWVLKTSAYSSQPGNEWIKTDTSCGSHASTSAREIFLHPWKITKSITFKKLQPEKNENKNLAKLAFGIADEMEHHSTA